MKTIVTTEFECEKCGATYSDSKDAAACEAKPIQQMGCKVGDFIGIGHHGWWNKDTSWTVSQPAIDGDIYCRDNGKWEKSPPGPFVPVKRAVLPIWRVVGIARIPCEHRVKILMWCPRHANRMGREPGADYGEGLCWTSSNHYHAIFIPEKLRPQLTTKEQARYAELVANPDPSLFHLV